MSDQRDRSSEKESEPIGRILPFAPQAHEEGASSSHAREPLYSEGDEPGKPYDVDERVQRVRKAAAPVSKLNEFETLAGIPAPSSSPSETQEPEPQKLKARWGPWDGSVARGLVIPIAIICVGLSFTFYSVAMYSPNFHGLKPAARYVEITIAFRVGLLIATALVGARLMEISLGRVVPATLKLSAIAVSPGIAVGVILVGAGMLGLSIDGGFTDYLNRPSCGSLAAAAISLGTVFLLFYLLFDLPQDLETWRFILLAWVIQFFVAGLFTHVIVDPPVIGPPYVPPRDPLHFSFGN